MEVLVLKNNKENYAISLLDYVFNVKYSEFFLHQFITSYISNSHIGQKSQKSRGEVSGGGKKPWRQKGSGRARVGSIRSPLWRGGGKIFAHNANINRRKKINKKMYKLGMMMILSQLFRDNRLFVCDNIFLNDISTKLYLEQIFFLNIKERSLVILKDMDVNTTFSSRNLEKVLTISYKDLTPLLLMKFKNIFITIDAIKALEENLK